MEVNTYIRNPLRVKHRAAYVYPSTYKVMISGLAPDIIYHLLNTHEDLYLERFVCERPSGLEDEPRSIETKSRLRDFSLILTSLHYEPDIVNLVRILISGGIEVFSSKREKTTIIAGGPVVMENPISYSDIIDAFIVGEAEVTLPEIIRIWIEYKDSKKRFLEEIDRLDYVYVPSLGTKKIKRKYVVDLNSVFYPIRQVENYEIEPVYGRGFKLEVSRGCRFHCSFCIETRVFQPYREREFLTLRDLIEKGMKFTLSGKRMIIYSLSFPVSNTHIKLLEYLCANGFKASLPSIRLSNSLIHSLDLIKCIGQNNLAIAPESFSWSLHRILFKYTGMVDYIVDMINRLLIYGFNVKLYLIYGFKGIQIDEINNDIRIIRDIANTAKKHGRRVSISLNPLVPKPHTMFQWIGMYDKETLLKILRVYKSALRGLVESRVYDVDWAIIQTQLALSPRALGVFIYKWASYGGGLSGWRKALRGTDIDLSYVYRGYSLEDELPWEFITLDEYTDKLNRAQYEVYVKTSKTL